MLCFLATILGVALPENNRAGDPNAVSPRAQVTVENWDKGGSLSRWVYTHVSEVFPTALVRRVVVVAYFGTNLTDNPKLEPLPCRIIAKTFF
jgi:hypothetical protein